MAAAVKTVPELFARHRGPGAGAVRPPPRPAAADFLTPLTAGTVDGLRRLGGADWESGYLCARFHCILVHFGNEPH